MVSDIIQALRLYNNILTESKFLRILSALNERCRDGGAAAGRSPARRAGLPVDCGEGGAAGEGSGNGSVGDGGQWQGQGRQEGIGIALGADSGLRLN